MTTGSREKKLKMIPPHILVLDPRLRTLPDASGFLVGELALIYALARFHCIYSVIYRKHERF